MYQFELFYIKTKTKTKPKNPINNKRRERQQKGRFIACKTISTPMIPVPKDKITTIALHNTMCYYRKHCEPVTKIIDNIFFVGTLHQEKEKETTNSQTTSHC